MNENKTADDATLVQVGKVIHMRMAKADKDDLRAMYDLRDILEEFFDYGTHTVRPGEDDEESRVLSDEDFVELLRGAWRTAGPAAFRVIGGCDVLIDNCCDPAKDYLDWKPELKRLMEESSVPSP